MVSGTRALPQWVVLEVEGGNWAAAPKGSMTYAFTHMGNFLFLLLLCPPAKSNPSQINPSIKAQIPVSRPKS